MTVGAYRVRVYRFYLTPCKQSTQRGCVIAFHCSQTSRSCSSLQVNLECVEFATLLGFVARSQWLGPPTCAAGALPIQATAHKMEVMHTGILYLIETGNRKQIESSIQEGTHERQHHTQLTPPLPVPRTRQLCLTVNSLGSVPDRCLGAWMSPQRSHQLFLHLQSLIDSEYRSQALRRKQKSIISLPDQ